MADAEARDVPPDPLDTQRLTWAVMLGRWVAFARSAVALPASGDEGRLRASVPDLIMLQAIWFALQHLDELDASERAVGLDRAEVLIERHTDNLRRRWGDGWPAMIEELITDVRHAVEEARRGGKGQVDSF